MSSTDKTSVVGSKGAAPVNIAPAPTDSGEVTSTPSTQPEVKGAAKATIDPKAVPEPKGQAKATLVTKP
ncbi:hypothetical protein [Pseudomonas gingeri]|uniref:hypothetical protein n=1 Tax=Pseudomonas gingeri TaxID=117681 RepID=UPI0015A02EF4|nr:hypothetical protein [Pseudomonas gingeri]NWA04716.1 hypothetical protein [Pseudomonas gingeri]NWA18191.1 hypothetical protein [Pseudomonas gingeri]NWA53583.1 hypothetical protein [Pseudomonas gingeri]NWA99353.1 hypothetical protein [Pseudomonas gingeri]NWB03513.1 hypothetical protein [Pseudomonas gingeri]